MAYANVSDLRSYMGITAADDDYLLEMLIKRAQKAIDDYCGRTFEASADDTREYTVDIDTDGRMLYLDGDLCAITSIKTNADATSPDTLGTSDYITHPRNQTPYHAIELKMNSDYIWTYTADPTGGVTVTGKWAWSTTAPYDIVHACLRLATYYYRQRDAGVLDTTAIPEAGIIQVPQGMPKDVQIILSPYRRNF